MCFASCIVYWWNNIEILLLLFLIIFCFFQRFCGKPCELISWREMNAPFRFCGTTKNCVPLLLMIVSRQEFCLLFFFRSVFLWTVSYYFIGILNCICMYNCCWDSARRIATIIRRFQMFSPTPTYDTSASIISNCRQENNSFYALNTFSFLSPFICCYTCCCRR